MNAKKIILFLRHFLLSSNYRLVRRRGVFDPGYFSELLGSEPELSNGDIETLSGYLKLTGNDYLLGLLTSGGWKQMPDPHPLFDTSYYLLQYFPNGLNENPLVHYLTKGWELGYQPGPFLEPDVYRLEGGWSEEDGDPLTHYTRFGASRGVSPSSFFDVTWFLNCNPILEGVRTEIIKHYKLHSSQAGESPIPCFSPSYYLEQVTCHNAKRDPLSHYICTSSRSDIRPNKWFDPVFYRKQGRSEIFGTSPLSDFLRRGVHEKQYTDERVAKLKDKPLISIIVPVYNTNLNFLNNCIRSVLYQSYPHWELCLVDDGSTDAKLGVSLLAWSAKDERIKVSFQDENTGIAHATNSGITSAKGEYVGFLDHDDELTPDCLYHVVKAITELGVKVIYTDEDLIGDNGRRLSVFYKPDLNPDLLMCHNYVVHFLVASTDLIKQVGGLDSKYDGAQDYDLILKLSEITTDIHHIPLVLYHWRASDSSTSINHENKPSANMAGRKALEKASLRRGITGAVEDAESRFYYRIRFKTQCEPYVSVFTNSKSSMIDKREELHRLEKNTQYVNCEYSVITNDGVKITNRPSGERQSLCCLLPESVSKSGNIGYFGQLHKEIITSHAEFIALLGTGISTISPTWLSEFTSLLDHRPEVGLVNGRVSCGEKDSNVYGIPDINNESPLYLRNFLTHCTVSMNWLHCSQQVTHGNSDFCMVRKSLYEEVGGFDYENFPNLFALLDLALRITERRKIIVYIPYASILLAEQDLEPPYGWDRELADEKIKFQEKWQDKLNTIDPFYNQGILNDNGINKAEYLAWLSGSSIAFPKTTAHLPLLEPVQNYDNLKDLTKRESYSGYITG